MPYLDDTDIGMAAKDLASMGRHELQVMRKGKSRKEQAALAPFEHRAYAREFAQDRPLAAAISLPVAIPAYTAAKALGLTDARSPASLEEMKQGFKGLFEGLNRRKKKGA